MCQTYGLGLFLKLRCLSRTSRKSNSMRSTIFHVIENDYADNVNDNNAVNDDQSQHSSNILSGTLNAILALYSIKVN